MATENLVRVNFLVSESERELFKEAARKANVDMSKALRILMQNFIRRYQKDQKFSAAIVSEREDGLLGDGSVKEVSDE